jgi:hypothetical protein
VPRPLMSAKTGRRKAPSAFAVGDDTGYASACVIDLYWSSTSEEEASPLESHRKRARKSHLPKADLEPSRAAVVEGIILWSTYFLVYRKL